MANLRDRLKRIQELKRIEVPHDKRPPSAGVSIKGWEICGFQVLKREVTVDTPLDTLPDLPHALAVLVPDLAGRNLPGPEDFVFFDLETTGLSGGAGTLAFLAAFGKPLPGCKLRITQYLLLDYPGESDFLDAVLGEFKNKESVIVSYNGKCFDSQILKNRCLVNRIRPPEYQHVDLLHPSRRLWRNIIHDCSQGSVETRILGIDRSGDIPGALAPEIWFDFLKTGETGRLTGICDHNCADIAGLAAVFAAVILISGDPIGANLGFDIERLALYWRNFLRRQDKLPPEEEAQTARLHELRITGEKILRYAADKKYPLAALVFARDLLRCGNYGEGRRRLLEISESSFDGSIRAAAFRALAIDSERRLKCAEEALEFARLGLELEKKDSSGQAEFEKRKERLEKKLKQEKIQP